VNRDQKLLRDPARNQTVNPNTRRKRFITATIAIVVVVTSLVGAYFLGNAASGTSSNAEEVIKQNLENTKKLALETEKIRKQVEDVMKQINVTMTIVSEMKEQLEALQMEANVLNQATVASIVSRYEWLSNNIREIVVDWQQGKVHPKFFNIFKFVDDCGGSCPIDLYSPKTCSYNA